LVKSSHASASHPRGPPTSAAKGIGNGTCTSPPCSPASPSSVLDAAAAACCSILAKSACALGAHSAARPHESTHGAEGAVREKLKASGEDDVLCG
jgi:hypothetical protein